MTKVMISLPTSLLIFLAIEWMDMGKDTTAFRERFNAYKNGTSVSEIYDVGLPRYEDGKPDDYQFEGYNYTYLNKTSKGHALSIKNGRLYSGDKIVGAGYTWHDKNNGNTYRTIGGGKFKLISTQEGIRLNLEKYLKYDREWFRDNSYKDFIDAIGEENLRGRDKLYRYRGEFVDKRYDAENKYKIPQHLPGVKRRTLSSGMYRGVKVYDNTLDSIYSNAKKNSISLNLMLGLAAETSLGKDFPITMNESKADYNERHKNPFYSLLFTTGDFLFPTDILNNHNYFVGNNATGVVNTLIGNKTIPGTKSWKDGQPFPIIGGVLVPGSFGRYLYTDLTDEQNSILNREAERVLKSKENSSDDPWKNAVDFYRKYNYGMGESYKNIIKKRGDSILNTPEIQSYLKHRE